LLASMQVKELNADGSEQRQLIPTGGNNMYPSVTDDGHLVFQSDRSGRNCIWRANLDGSDMRQVTGEGVAVDPNASPDGKWIVYSSSDDDLGQLYRISIDGGEPRLLTRNRAGWGRISPNSKLVACSYEDAGKAKLAVLSIEGGEPVNVFDVPRLANLRAPLCWTMDGKAVCYRDWANGIWRQNVDGGEPERLPGLPKEKLQGYGWAHDGNSSRSRAPTPRRMRS
jgi:TolB protein